MAYQAPSLSDLRNFAAELEASYQGSNQQRRSFIALLKQLTTMTASSSPAIAEKVLLGAIVFELESISSEYRFSSPLRSDIYSQLIKKLNITTTNVLGDDERLINLHRFNSYVSRLFSEKTIAELKEADNEFIWTNKDALLKKIHDRLKGVRVRDATRIDQMIHATPELDALQKNIERLSADYRKMAAAQQQGRWFGKDASRDPLVNFIDFIHLSCNHFYPEEHKKIPRMYNMERDIRRGLILLVLMKIYRSYKYLSPEGGWVTSGSTLFKESLQVLNVKSIDDICAEEKADLLKALAEHIKEVRNSPDYNQLMAAWKEKGLQPLVTEQDFFLDRITKYRDEQEILKHQPQGKAAAVSTVASYAAQSGAMYAVQQGAGGYAAKLALGTVAAAVGGPVAIAVYAGGSLVLTGLGKMMGDGLISSATASLYSWLLDRVGSSIGSATASVFSFSYNVSSEGLAELRKRLAPEDEKIFCDWVNTLLAMRPDIVSENDKHSIRYVFGIDAGCELLPLPPRSPATSARLTSS